MSFFSFPSFPHPQPGGLLGAIVAGSPPPGQMSSPAETKAGVETAWDVMRSFWSMTAPWQHGVYAAIRDQYGGVG
ncbi:MAG TPA: hypothetical protein VHQ90_00105 [Thermoanaerobaculia bacterium]|nr:hypothetical protein [Thermoanaerobaculia bacterium]